MALVTDRWRGMLFGLGAAFLFGVGAPLGKLLVQSAGPFLLAALLYLGAGVSLALFGLGRRKRGARSEARLRRADLPVLGAIMVLGGVVGPVLMLMGLKRVSGIAGALLLNLEAPFTIGLAVTLGFGFQVY